MRLLCDRSEAAGRTKNVKYNFTINIMIDKRSLIYD